MFDQSVQNTVSTTLTATAEKKIHSQTADLSYFGYYQHYLTVVVPEGKFLQVRLIFKNTLFWLYILYYQICARDIYGKDAVALEKTKSISV